MNLITTKPDSNRIIILCNIDYALNFMQSIIKLWMQTCAINIHVFKKMISKLIALLRKKEINVMCAFHQTYELHVFFVMYY